MTTLLYMDDVFPEFQKHHIFKFQIYLGQPLFVINQVVQMSERLKGQNKMRTKEQEKNKIKGKRQTYYHVLWATQAHVDFICLLYFLFSSLFFSPAFSSPSILLSLSLWRA